MTPQTPPIFKKIAKEDSEAQVKRFKEIVWLCGKRIGHVEGFFKVTLPFTISQMSIGTMTQNGIQFNKALVLNDLKKYRAGPLLQDDPKSNMF